MRSMANACRPRLVTSPAMRAGADGRIFAVAPVDQVVQTLCPVAGVIGHLIGRHRMAIADLLRQIVETPRGIVRGHGELAGGV